jgi:general secretion pathway protein F
MRFEVRALSPDNLIETHTVDAPDPKKRGRLLSSGGCNRCRSGRRRRGRESTVPGRGNKSFSLLLFSAELHALLEAGLSLVEAFEALLEKESSPVSRSVLERLTVTCARGCAFPLRWPASPTSSRRSTSASSALPREPATCRARWRATSTTRRGWRRCATR